MFARPYRIMINQAALAKARLKSAAKRMLKEVHQGYIRDTAAWIDQFAPADTHDLRTDLKASTQEGFISTKGADMELVLHLRSRVPYAPFVNAMNPVINWTNMFTQYHYFKVLTNEINDNIIPYRSQLAAKNEGLI